MYVQKLHVRRLKLLHDFELDFTRPDGKPRMWTVVIGPNGTGKTSLLHAIALASAGPAQVNRLGQTVIPHLRDRRTSGHMTVSARFRLSIDAHADLDDEWRRRLAGYRDEADEQLSVRSTLELRRGDSTIFGHSETAQVSRLPRGRVDPLDLARTRNTPGWFVAGYGVGRFLPRPADSPLLQQPSIERLEPLFPSGVGLTSLRFIDHFADEKARRYTRLLRDALTGVADLVPDLEGIELRGSGGVSRAGQLIEKDRFQLRIGPKRHRLPAIALSHGYQSTIAWIADLIGHYMLENDGLQSAADIEGLVLIDEIDLYLHPVWQVNLIPALRRTFPNVQFVVTTHSPVVLSGLAADEIIRLGLNQTTGHVERFGQDPETGRVRAGLTVAQLEDQPDPRTMTGTEVYRTWFGLDRLHLHPYGRELTRYLQLATDPFRSDSEEDEMGRLADQLDELGIAHAYAVERRV